MTSTTEGQQQFGATDPGQSAWVAANAGSGKTYVLVNRIARLLLSGSAPDRLLCLTFTKAAAAEMSMRLFERLGKWTLMADDALAKELYVLSGVIADAPLLARARKLFAIALESPGGLRIQTIHAFCERLLKRFPLEANVVPQFSVLDERSTGELLNEARDLVLQHAAQDDPALADAISALTQYSAEAQFDELVHAAISERSWIDSFIRSTSRGDIEARLWNKLRLEPQASTATVLSAALSVFDPAELRRVARALGHGTKTDVAKAPSFERLANERTEAALERVLAGLLTVEGKLRAKLASNDALDADITLGPSMEKFGRAALDIRQKQNALFIGQMTANLLHIAGEVLTAYHALKRRRAMLDYDDLINHTASLFKSPGAAWVLYKLDGGIDHILIDEAQDTSLRQWDIVRAIAQEFFSGIGADRGQGPAQRTVFAVGDVKQSIMSFQGARPEEFIWMRDHIQEQTANVKARFELIELKKSYRSAPRILELVDDVFSDPAASEGVVIESVELRHDAERCDMAGCVELWPAVTPPEMPERIGWDAPRDRISGNHPVVSLAQKIATRVGKWLQTGAPVYDKHDKKFRPMAAGDVMVLVRRRGMLAEEIIRQLKRNGIPVAGADRLKLAKHIAVMDLIALGRFALLPLDDLTLATVLKGPLCGVDEEALFDLAHGRGKTRLWAVLQDRAKTGDALWVRVHTYLKLVIDLGQHLQPFEFYSSVLTALGGWTKLLARLGYDAADPVEEFLNIAMDFGQTRTPSLEGFLHALEHAETEIKRDQDRGDSAVRVLTVHGSKGLEAPVVILPDTCTTPGHGSHDKNLLRAGDTPLWKLLSRRDDPVRSAAREEGKAERMNEYRRLLYVALTRARDRLVVCGYEGSDRAPDPGRWYDLVKTAMSRLGAVEVKDDTGDMILRFGVLPDPLPVEARGQKVLDAALPDWMNVRAPSETVSRRVSPSSAGTAARRARQGDGAEAGRQRGLVVHRILEKIATGAPETWSAIASRLAHEAIADEAAAQSAAGEALRVRRDAQLCHLFGPGSYGEVPVLGTIEWQGARTEVAGRLDRVIVEEHGVTIIEFKTDRVVPHADSDIPRHYLRQLALYRRAVAALFDGKAINCGILWTAEPRLTLIPVKYLHDVERELDPANPVS